MDGPISPTPEAEPEHHAGALVLSGEGNVPPEPEADR
jgi:hypothetical protein